ncbi:OLC1v1033112C1 [Oldenlandia corymbosa var. corymbosa]|uniref:OLC1v1033112C1 n=1 Tax=Oldenlandia corymbosa var. corymbosa TaxID=529605 RepID=A0AAV1CNA3_OLDCO|nr:OLC1v1033112C1 [Oldenlandia corymbosa var. corymbosa]
MDTYGVSSTHTYVYRQSATRITILAHLFGITAIILLLVWLLHFREGIHLDSDNPFRIFNVHPFMMFFGFIFFVGEAMMVYKTVPAPRNVQKIVHLLLHLLAIAFGIIGLHAVFKFHSKANFANLRSLHSWIGIGTFSLFILQWLFGLVTFMVPGSTTGTRARAAPWHISGGRALFYMAIIAAETGLMEKVTLLELQYSTETRLINFLGLAILLFGITVDLSVALARYV